MKKLITLTVAAIAAIWSTTAQEPAFIVNGKISTTYGYVNGYYDAATQQYLTKSDYISKYGKDSFKQNLDNYKSSIAKDKKAADNLSMKHLSLRPKNVIAGASIIGLSVPVLIATDVAFAKSIENKMTELAELQIPNNRGEVDNNKIEKTQNKINSLQKAQKTMKWVCAGTSLAGVVVLLTGLEYTNDGVKVTDNLSFNGSGMTVRF